MDGTIDLNSMILLETVSLKINIISGITLD